MFAKFDELEFLFIFFCCRWTRSNSFLEVSFKSILWFEIYFAKKKHSGLTLEINAKVLSRNQTPTVDGVRRMFWGRLSAATTPVVYEMFC